MEICSNNHDEIVFSTRYCPLCSANDKIEGLESEIVELNDKITNLEA